MNGEGTNQFGAFKLVGEVRKYTIYRSDITVSIVYIANFETPPEKAPRTPERSDDERVKIVSIDARLNVASSRRFAPWLATAELYRVAASSLHIP